MSDEILKCLLDRIKHEHDMAEMREFEQGNGMSDYWSGRLSLARELMDLYKSKKPATYGLKYMNGIMLYGKIDE